MKPRLKLSTLLIVIGIIALAVQGIKTASHVARCRSKARDYAEAEQRSRRAIAWELGRPAVLRAELDATCNDERERAEKINALTRDLIARHADEAATDPEIARKIAQLEVKMEQRMKDCEIACEKEAARIAAKIRESEAWASAGRQFAAYDARMKAKYLDAAAHPWRTLPPDEPMPTWTYRDLPQYRGAAAP